MSVSAPAWRFAPRCHFFNASSLPIRTRGHQRRPLSFSPSRMASEDDKSGGEPPKQPNPVLDEYLRKHPTSGSGTPGQVMQAGGPGSQGDISASSIFEDERRAQQQQQQQAEQAERDAAGKHGGVPEMKTGSAGRDPQNMRRILDPNPNARLRWERKQVMQMVKRGGRLSKTQFIKRIEREHLVKSHMMKTSTKKLGALARQIQGKTIDDAITQMRFSKKKVAVELRKQLEAARDEAVVMRGMGLGKVQEDDDADNLNNAYPAISDTTIPDVQNKKNDESVDIQLKDGKRHTVSDRSTIYIDQAWVGRGPYGTLPDYRARGRVFVMRTPWTSISLLLKEEATRIREYGEREDKRRRQKLGNVWVHLPDRPIQTKQQWYSW